MSGQRKKTVYSPGGITEGGMVYEQVDKDGTIQYATKTLKEDAEIVLKPHLEMGPHVIYFPLTPCPWTLPPPPEPYSSVEDLWDKIWQFTYDHLDLENEILYDVYVAWVLATWIPERWQTAPYLHFHGPSNSGKTRALDILCQLSYRPLLSPSVSAASIYRALDAFHPTFLLDEFELYEKMREIKAEVIGVLNAGYKKGQYVLRTDKIQDGAPVLRGFSCFGPKAIGSIMELPTTLHGRTIRFGMSRAIRKVKRLINYARARELRANLLFYRFEHVFDSPPEGNPIDLPDGRLIELYTPLCLVAPKELEEKILEHARTQYREDIEMERVTVEAKVFTAIIDLLRVKPRERILQQSIRDHINVDLPEKEQFSKAKVGYVLRRLGFKNVLNVQERLMEIVVDPAVLERRKQRYVLPEEKESVEEIIAKLKELKNQPKLVEENGVS